MSMRSSNGPGYFRAVALNLERRAGALFLRVGEKTAGARVHRSHQHETGGVIDRPYGARNGYVAVFQGLAHHLENVALELR